MTTTGTTTTASTSSTSTIPSIAPDARRFSEAFRRRGAEIAAVPADELASVNLDVPSAVTAAMGVLPNVRAMRPQIAELPSFSIAQFDAGRLMLIADAPGSSRLQYAGAGTWFDPPPADREEMRTAARRVGTLLAEEHGFAGTFTIDGILGADGWLPNELNPRYGAGMGYANVLHPELAFSLVHQMLIEGDAPDVRAADVEALLLPGADETRWGGGWSMIPTRFDETETVRVRFEGEALRVARPDEVSDGELLSGPNAVGGYVRLNLEPDRVPKGPSIAPRVVAALALADELWDAGIGPLEPATPVR